MQQSAEYLVKMENLMTETLNSETLMCVLPGEIILSKFTIKNANLKVEKDTGVSMKSDNIKNWIKMFRSFLICEIFEKFLFTSENVSTACTKENNCLVIFSNRICNGYVVNSHFVFDKCTVTKLLYELPRLFTASLCLRPEINLIFDSLIEKFEVECLENFKANGTLCLNHGSPEIDDFLNSIETLVQKFNLSLSPYSAFTILHKYRNIIKYLLQARTIKDFLESKKD